MSWFLLGNFGSLGKLPHLLRSQTHETICQHEPLLLGPAGPGGAAVHMAPAGPPALGPPPTLHDRLLYLRFTSDAGSASLPIAGHLASLYGRGLIPVFRSPMTEFRL